MLTKADINGFRFRLLLYFTILTLLITATSAFIYVHSEIRSGQNQARERLHLLAMQLASDIRLPLFAHDTALLQQSAQNTISRFRDIAAITISTNDGLVLYSHARKEMPVASHLLETSLDVHSSSFSLSPASALTGGNDGENQRIGLLKMSLDISQLAADTRDSALMAALVAFLFWLAVSLTGYFVLENMTRSFRTLMAGLEQIKEGDYSVRIAVEKEDEAGHAALAVNSLAETLQSREEENKRLQTALVDAMRLEVQEEKKQMMARLIQANRMTFLGLLASSMAHEINNPNASIRLAGLFLTRAWGDAIPLLQQMARDEGDFSLGGIPFTRAQNEVLQSCAGIERATNAISHVIQDLRNYSLGSSSEYHPNVSVNQVVNDAISTVRAYGRYPDVNIAVDTRRNLPFVNGCKHQLEQVVVNLLLNAMQAMAGKPGAIAVRTAFSPRKNQVMIAIKDEGVGIDPENLERLAEPFYSTRIGQGGSGLGLFVANHIISEHNGSLKFISQPGSGTTVSVLLPVHNG